MDSHVVRSIEIEVPAERAHAFVADPNRLPQWTHAFATVRGRQALMRTPAGEVDVELEVDADALRGTIDWRMTFPDGTVETAYSRLVPAGDRRSVFSFVLLAPQAGLEALEGGLERQAETLETELTNLRRLLEA